MSGLLAASLDPSAMMPTEGRAGGDDPCGSLCGLDEVGLRTRSGSSTLTVVCWVCASSHAAQPALLYLVPCTLIPVTVKVSKGVSLS